MKIFDICFWQYLFSDFNKIWDEGFLSGIKIVICRFNGHSCGCIYYSSGFEPDWRCKNCGEYLG